MKYKQEVLELIEQGLSITKRDIKINSEHIEDNPYYQLGYLQTVFKDLKNIVSTEVTTEYK